MTMPPARLAVVTSTDAAGASARYRALQHVPRLGRWYDVDVIRPAPQPPESVDRSVHARAAFFVRQGARYAVRTAQLHQRLPGHDAVLVQRGAFSLGPGTVVRPVERFEGRVVVDLDDAVFHVSAGMASRGTAARWLYGPHQVRRLLDRADAIVVSTQQLADSLPVGTHVDAVLPTVPDPVRYEPKVHAETPCPVVGWVGNAGNLPHLALIDDAVSALRRARTAEVEIVSSEPWRPDVRFRRWTLLQETEDLLRFDIGVMPLFDSPYSRAKSAFKLTQYLAAGLPVVASPVGINVDIVEESGAGYLASSRADWTAALSRLARDPAERAERGRSGRAWLESYVDMDHQAGVLHDLIRGSR